MLTVRRADKRWETFTFLKQNSNANSLLLVFKSQIIVYRISISSEFTPSLAAGGHGWHGVFGLSGLGELLPVASSRQGLGPLTGLFSQRSCPGPQEHSKVLKGEWFQEIQDRKLKGVWGKNLFGECVPSYTQRQWWEFGSFERALVNFLGPLGRKRDFFFPTKKKTIQF